MRPARWGLGLTAVLLAGFTGVRDPGSNGPIVFSSLPVTVMIQQAGSDDISDGSDIEAIRAALEAWNQPSCSSFQFVDGGLTASRNIAQDGVNVVTFVESGWPGSAMGAGAFAVRYRNTGVSPQVWTEGDVRINGEEFEWATNGDPDRLDVQSIVTHELGHVLGLFHSTRPEATMYFRSVLGRTYGRTLHDDDIAGLCYLYPSGNFSCQDDDDCPMLLDQYGGGNLRLQCNNGACVAGPVSFGGECAAAADCRSSRCVEDPVGPPATEPGFCTEVCTLGGNDCPAGSYCSDKPTGAPRCFPARVDCIDNDDCAALTRGSCGRDLDGLYRCRSVCVENANCEVTEVCQFGNGMLPATGVCRVPGASADGVACEHSLECQSLLCTSGGVNPTCTPGVPGFDSDAGVAPDSGVTPDTGVMPDAGLTPDAGSPPDAADVDGGGPDAGPLPDAGDGQDAAQTPDADTPDAAATGSDGGAGPGSDASFGGTGLGPGSDSAISGGCRCVSNASDIPLWVFALGFVAFLRRRRGS